MAASPQPNLDISEKVIMMRSIYGEMHADDCQKASSLSLDRDKYPFCYYDLIEVFSLRVLEKQGKHLYAKLLADDNITMHLLYDRQKKNKGDKEEEEEDSDSDDDNELLMIGPNKRNLIGCDPMIFILILSNETTNTSYRFHVPWAGHCDPYDVPLTAILACDIGTVIMTFAVFAEPVAAKVQVALTNDSNNNNGNVDICGWITACNSAFGRPECKTLLFKKKKPHNMRKKQKTTSDIITLSKSVVAVPLPSSLIIEMHLFDGNTGKVIAEGRQEFKPDYGENNSKEIPNSNITVTVNWEGTFFEPRSPSSVGRHHEDVLFS